jgi:imidazolonepropionase-like amidohydrolase
MLPAILFFLAALPVSPQETQPAPETREAKEEGEKEAEEDKKKEKVLAIRGGDVYTVTAGTLRGGTVLVRGKKIWKVGTDLEVPKDAQVLDVANLRVYPGLVAAETTGILARFGSADSPADAVDPFALSLQLASASGITTAVSGSAVAKVIPGDIEDMIVREPAFSRLNLGTAQARRELREKLEKAREYLRAYRRYEQEKKRDPALKEPDKKGIDENSLKLLRREIAARVPAGSREDLLRVADLALDFGFDAIVDSAYEAWTIAGELGRAGVRCVVDPRQKIRPDRETARPSGSSIENAAILRRAGIEVAVVPPQRSISTGGIAGRDYLTFPLDAAFAMRGGLDADAALETITIGAARVLGVDDRVGSIEPGKDADLLVASGDLLDFRTIVEWTIVNGKIAYDRREATFFSHLKTRRDLAPPPEPIEEETPATAPAEEEKAEEEKKEEGSGEERPPRGEG